MSGWNWGSAWGEVVEEEDEDNEGVSSSSLFSGRDSVIFLIDCSLGMFSARGKDGEKAIEICIKCARTVLLNKIISSEKDLVGVVLFGTDKEKNPSEFKHVYILQDLDQPDAPRIKELDQLLEGVAADTFSTDYGHSSDYSLNDVFWTCSNMFANSPVKLASKRVFMFTNNDDPHSSSLPLQRQAKTKAKDMADTGIDIELLYLPPPDGSSFNLSRFYQDVMMMADDEVSSLPDPAERFEELLTRVRSKDYKKRALQRIPFFLGNGVQLGIGVYTLVRETKKPSFVRLDRRNNEEVKAQTKYLCEDTGSELMPSDIKYYQEFGGEKAIFEKDEVTAMKRFAEPGLLLLGFKPRSRLKPHYYVKPGNFIYPDETVISGSTKLFSALLKRCLARDVMAICRYIPRANAAPSFVALVPQEEEQDKQGIQIAPPGFHALFLPHMEDMRKLKIDDTPKAPDDVVDKAKEIVKKLMFTFNPESFENPALQKHYRILEAIALDQEEVEEVADLTLPDHNRIETRAGNAIDSFMSTVFPNGVSDGKTKAGTKRKPSESGTSAKKSKSASESDDLPNVEDFYKNNTLTKLTVAVLKDFLKSVGRKATGKKQDLVQEVEDYFVNLS
jgi:ATP-dependent DNA helicase 2 subunit 1